MTLTPDQERWAETFAILDQYGDQTPPYIAERIGALARAGDRAGIARWKEIAARYDQYRQAAKKPV